MTRPPLFVELCAGTAAVSLRLHGGRYARPPVARMGSKSGYATVLLECLGLYPGQGADAYLWCEPDPGCRLMLCAYGDPEVRAQAAAIIRGWANEEPRALWERLRAEGPPRGVPEAFVPGVGAVDPAEVARRVAYRAGVHPGGGGFRGLHCNRPNDVGFRPKLPYLPASLTRLYPSGAVLPAAIEPREVARWILTGVWSYRQGVVDSGFVGPGDRRQDTTATATASPALVVGGAIEPFTVPDGTITYIDPPYSNTTGYANHLPRSEVIRLARAWADAGAWVVVSEAEPIQDLLDDGWHAVEITDGRVGQTRTFSRQQREWLTMSRAPTWRPSDQVGLFGGGQ